MVEDQPGFDSAVTARLRTKDGSHARSNGVSQGRAEPRLMAVRGTVMALPEGDWRRGPLNNLAQFGDVSLTAVFHSRM